MIIQKFEAQPFVRSFHGGKTKFAQLGDPTSTFVQVWSMDGSTQINELVGRNVRITVEVMDDEPAYDPTDEGSGRMPSQSRAADGPIVDDDEEFSSFPFKTRAERPNFNQRSQR